MQPAKVKLSFFDRVHSAFPTTTSENVCSTAVYVFEVRIKLAIHPTTLLNSLTTIDPYGDRFEKTFSARNGSLTVHWKTLTIVEFKKGQL